MAGQLITIGGSLAVILVAACGTFLVVLRLQQTYEPCEVEKSEETQELENTMLEKLIASFQTHMAEKMGLRTATEKSPIRIIEQDVHIAWIQALTLRLRAAKESLPSELKLILPRLVGDSE